MRQLAMKYIGGRITTEVSDEIRIRNYTPEDFEQMLDALVPLTVNRYEETDLDNVILKKVGVNPEGVFVAEVDGKIVGTATGYFHPAHDDKPGDNGGTLHMVSALASASGKGVGRAVCASAVNYLVDAGCEYVDLTTDDFRLPAIVTYMRLGFRPVIDDAEMEERWSALAEKLGIPAIIKEAYR